MSAIERTTDEILAGILHRWITTTNSRPYYCWTDSTLTLDATLDITPEEAEALDSVGERQGWWEKATARQDVVDSEAAQ